MSESNDPAPAASVKPLFDLSGRVALITRTRARCVSRTGCNQIGRLKLGEQLA